MLRRFLPFLMLLFAVLGGYPLSDAQAQATALQPGDPPLLARISVTPPVNGVVTIVGEPGAVFSNAFLAIRNLYTGATAYTRASSNGAFDAEIAAVANTPFWLSPSASEISLARQQQPGILPGGPGIIVYGTAAEASSAPITQIRIDGDLSDWAAYPDAPRASTETRTAYAIRNNNSIYLGFSGTYVTTAYARVEIRFTVDITSYAVTLNPRQAQAALLARLNPLAADLGTLIVAARQSGGQNGGLELRIPLSFVQRAERVRLDSVRWLNASGGEIQAETIDMELPLENENDGIAYAQTSEGSIPFVVDSVTQAGAWSASGETDRVALDAGDDWNLTLDVDFAVTGLPPETRFIGRIALQPVALTGADGQTRVVSGVGSSNGWSSSLTPSGLPIDNLRSEILLGEAAAEPFQLVRDADSIAMPFSFGLALPNNLPAGLYVPLFMGYTQVGESLSAWDAPDAIPARLPLILNVGGVETTRLLWTLFADDPSNGSRGVTAAEDATNAALSNRVRFNSPTYILPPFAPASRDPLAYSFEPYLLNQLANSNSQFSAPLIPFLFTQGENPSGTLNLRITRPDGTTSMLSDLPIVQNQLASSPEDPRLRFGRQSPLNEYRLTTLDPRLTQGVFDQYGEYTLELTGSLQDAWGNLYEGGGTYTVLSAELLVLTPGVMSGTPFVVGDALNAGLHLAPGVPADVSVTLRVHPLDGSAMIEHSVSGRANAHGYFQPNDEPFMFEIAGEYTLDYEARYTDSTGRLWAASMRSAGVIAPEPAPNTVLVAHGERGLPGVDSALRPAWFSLPQYAAVANIAADAATLSLPYHSGDVIRLRDGEQNTLLPRIRVQSVDGAYTNWLLNEVPDDATLRQRAAEGELPVFALDGSENVTYFTAARPNVTVRQFVAGEDDGGQLLGWDNDDPLNQQFGAGIDGNAPFDVIFLFGGAVIRSPEAAPSSAVYGALAVITSDEAPSVLPPDRGAAGGVDGGALLTINGQRYDAFINLTGVQPGDVLTLGDTVTVAGQVAPALGAQVQTTYISPSGEVQQFVSRANPVGMYYDPATQFAVDQTGTWTVEVRVIVDGLTSAGQTEPPYPQGGILGAADGRFTFTVIPADNEPLVWNALLRNAIIPTVSPYNFSFTLPEDWSNIEASYALTTPGYVIEAAPIRMNGRTFSYTYSTTQQTRTFPNLENDGDEGAFRSDMRTLTFVASGTDAQGTRQTRTRTFTILHDHLLTLE